MLHNAHIAFWTKSKTHKTLRWLSSNQFYFSKKEILHAFYAKAPAAKPFDTLWQFFSVGKVITIFPFVWVLRVLPPFFVPQMLFIMAPVLSVTVLLMTWLWRRWKLCEGCWLCRLRGHCGLPGSNKLRQSLICNTDTHFLQVKTALKLECVRQNFHEKRVLFKSTYRWQNIPHIVLHRNWNSWLTRPCFLDWLCH